MIESVEETVVYIVRDVCFIIFIIFDYPINEFALSGSIMQIHGILLLRSIKYYFLEVLSINKYFILAIWRRLHRLL